MQLVKRGLFVFFVYIVLSIFLMSFVSAGITEDVSNAIDNIIVKPLNPFLKFVVGDFPDGQMLLIKFLALILILAVGYSGAKKVPGLQNSKPLSFLVALVIAIIGTRYLTTTQIVEFIWLPQGVFAVVVATLAPFILFFFLIESFESRVIRKTGWITFCVVYIGLAIYRWENLRVGEQFWENFAWIYLIVGILSGLAIYFDKQLRSRFVLSSLGKELSGRNLVSAAKFMEDIDDQIKVRDRAIKSGNKTEQAVAQREINRLQVEIAKLK